MHALKSFAATISAAYEGWSKDHGSLLAAALAYYVAIAFFPMLLILLSLFGVFLSVTNTGQDARSGLLRVIGDQLSPELSQQVAKVLDAVEGHASVGGPIGLVTLLITAIAIFAQLEMAFDRIWNVPQRERGVVNAIKQTLFVRLKAFLMLLALGGIVVVIFFANLALSTAESAASDLLPMNAWTTWAVQLAVTTLTNTIVFAFLYKLVPKAHVRWLHALQGGLLAAVTWEVGRQILSAFVITSKYNSAYGVVGAFLAVLLWGYYAANVVFFAAEFTRALADKS